MDRAILVVSAMALNAALGGPRQWYEAAGLSHLSPLPARFIRNVERKLNREHRSDATRRTRGLILALALLAASLSAGCALSWLLRANARFGEMLLLATLLPIRPSWDCARHIRKYLNEQNIAAARQVLSNTSWRHHALLDEYGLARAAIETLAVSFSEKILAPALWYLLLGLPGLFASKAIYLLQETLSQPMNPHHNFGQAAARMHYVMHYLPSRLAALLWLLASLFLPSVKLDQETRQISAGFLGASPQTLSLIAAAAMLKLSLGGPTSIYTASWVGSGNPKPTIIDIGRALYLFTLLQLFLLILFGALS